MAFEVQNTQWLRKLAPQSFADLANLGPRLYKALQSVQVGVRNIEQQTNADANLHPAAPPPPDGVSVTAANGIFHASVTHNQPIYRGIRYHGEYSESPNFTNPFPISMGESREWRGALGNLNLHFRFASSYGNSAPSAWVYHGGQASPALVAGGGVSGPALPSQSQGSGTGQPGEGFQGPGQRAYRSTTGAPPVRSGNRGTA
jgi:hypothetical protein